jgi:hypothetical protein
MVKETIEKGNLGASVLHRNKREHSCIFSNKTPSKEQLAHGLTTDSGTNS